MGMLQLAGAVSGAGKGLQQGLSQMQNTMSNMTLQQLRDENELARMRETFAHDEGLLQQRQVFDLKRDDRQHARNLDLEENRQDFEAGQRRIGREFERQKGQTEFERNKELEDLREKNRINELIVQGGLSQQEAAQKAKEERAREERDRAEKRRARQEDIGKDIVVETIRNQRPTQAGTSHLDPVLASQIKDYDVEIASLLRQKEDLLNNSALLPNERKSMVDDIDRKILAARNKKASKLGVTPEADPSSPGRVDISQFDKFKGSSPLK